MALVLDWARRHKSISMRKYVKAYNANGQDELHYFNPNRVAVENIVFLNFPQLHICKNQVLNCTFENCGMIYLNAPYIPAFCTFRNIKGLFCSGKELLHCRFADSECTEGAFVRIDNCRMKSCRFNHIKLSKDAVLMKGNGKSWISYCRFNNIVSERDREAWFYHDRPEPHFLTKAWPKPVFIDDTCSITNQFDEEEEE